LTALTRVGVTFTESQRDVIRSLTDAGNVAAAQAEILAAVAGQVGGVAEAMGGGLSGAVDLVSKRFNDLQEELGAALIPVLTNVNQRIADLFARMTQSGAVGKLGEAIAQMAAQAAAAAEDLINRADFGRITAAVSTFAQTTTERLQTWGRNVAAVSEGITRTFQGTLAVFRAVQQAVELVTAAVTGTLSLALRGIASLSEGMASLGLSSEQAAAKWRAAQETFAQATADLVARANQHWAEAKDAAAQALGVVQRQAVDAAEAVATLDTQMGLSVEQFEALGDAASYAADGQASLASNTEAGVSAAARSTDALRAQVAETLALAEARKRDLEAAEDALRIAEQEGSLRLQRLANLEREARARGELARAQEIGQRLAREEANVASAVAQSARSRADAASAYAEALRAQADATNDTAEATLASLAAADASAKSLQIEAAMAGEAARAARALANARRSAAGSADELADSAGTAAGATATLGAAADGAAGSLGALIGQAINRSIDSLGTYSQAARDAAAAIKEGWSGSFGEMTARIAGMDAAALVANDRLGGMTQEMAQLEAQAAATAERLEAFREAAASPETFQGWRPLAEGLKNLAEFEKKLADAAIAQKRLEIGSEQLATALDDLRRQYQSGALSLDVYNARLIQLQDQFGRLGDERLEGLRSAIADARRQMDALRDSAQDTLDSLQDELDQLEGRQDSIEQRDYDRRRAEIEAELAEARDANNQEAIRALQESLAVLNRVHAKRMSNLAAERDQEREINREIERRNQVSEQVAPSRTSPAGDTTGAGGPLTQTTRVVEIRVQGAPSVRVMEADADDLLEILRRAGLAAA
jgi:hypothetical protein